MAISPQPEHPKERGRKLPVTARSGFCDLANCRGAFRLLYRLREPEAVALTPKSFQKPRLIAKYGMSATSASPGAGSLKLKTASVLQSLREWR